MRSFLNLGVKLAAAAIALSSIGTPAMARDWHDRGDYGYHDRSYRYDDDVRLRGPGVNNLDPWLRNAKNGRKFVVKVLGTHRVSERGAWIVNREFAYSRGDRHRGWDRGDRYSDRRR